VSNELQARGTQAVASANDWSNPDMLVARINKMHEIMRRVMKEGTHYGKIPGCQQNTLLQPGSQLLSVAFCVGHDPRVEDLSGPGEIRYRVTDRVFDQKTGETITFGVGECSSNEEKYAWRRASSDDEFEETDPDRRRIKTGKYTAQQVRTNPADVANTVLKMAHKRANVSGTINALAASDIFTQDLEDLPDGMELDGRAPVTESSRPNVAPPTAAPQAAPAEDREELPDDETRKKNGWISAKQVGFFHGKLEEAGVDYHAVENFMRAYRKEPGWKLWKCSWRKDRMIKGEKEMDYLLKVAQEQPAFFAKYAPVKMAAGNGPKT
jgi:hypothetical protein